MYHTVRNRRTLGNGFRWAVWSDFGTDPRHPHPRTRRPGFSHRQGGRSDLEREYDCPARGCQVHIAGHFPLRRLSYL
jgi:hypothetical protein